MTPDLERVDGCLVLAMMLAAAMCTIRVGVGLMRGEPVDGVIATLSVLGGMTTTLAAAMTLHALQDRRKQR